MMETFAIASGAPTVCAKAADRAIDLVHLARMTFGDRTLEREVLELFVRQAGTILATMETADPTAAGALAHRLKGSAQGIGAWRVAAAAESVEHAAAMRPGEFTGAIATLAGRIEEARSVVQELLRSH